MHHLITALNDINCIIKYTNQRCKRCTFDSPGLPSDSAGYPGLMYGLRGTTPSVLRFLRVIRHEYPRYKPAFSKKLNTYSVESPCECLPRVGSFLANPGLSKEQHLRRCTMRTFLLQNTFIELLADFAINLFVYWH